MQDLELKVLDSISAIKSPLLDRLMIFFSSLSDHGELWITIGILSAIYFLICERRSTSPRPFLQIENTERYLRKVPRAHHENVGLIILIALIFSFLITNLTLKPLVSRIRPYEVKDQVKLLVGQLKDFSFPSGHTSASFAAATAIWLSNRKWGIAALILASIIAFSRLYLYVHFPTDILGGAVIGAVSALLAQKIYRWGNRKW